MEFQLVEQNSLIPEIPDGQGEHGDPGLEPPSPACGYTVDGSLVENGTISSPGYPDNYPAFLDCKWRIQAAPGKKILAAFSEFDVTANTNCNSDYVVINTGKDSSKYCGKSVPKEIESVGEILEIEFHTNQGDSCRGESLLVWFHGNPISTQASPWTTPS